MFARATQRLATRAFATLPPATSSISVPLTTRLEAQKVAFYTPKKSDPVEGFMLAGTLAGTMVLCMAPAILAVLSPAPAEH